MALTSRLLLAISALLSAYIAVFGAGFVFKLAPLTYYVDDWVWLSFNVMDAAGSFCRITGHPTIMANLAMAANYEWFGGSPLGRAVAAGAVHVLGMGLIGTLAVAGTPIDRLAKWAIIFAFACAGLSGAMSSKLFWSFGLTDGFVLVGGGISVLGLHLLTQKRFGGWALILFGTAVGAFSFGTGLVLPAALTFALLCLRMDRRGVAAYLALAAVMLWVSMVWLPACEKPPSPVGEINFAPWTIVSTAAGVLAYFPAYVVGRHNELGTPTLAPYWVGLGFLLIAAIGAHALHLLMRGEKDAFRLGLAALAVNLVGATLLIGLTRAATYGVEVAFQARYAPITTAFWILAAGIIVREMATAKARYVVVAPLTISLLFATANTLQAPHYLAFHRHLASSAASVILAAKSGHENENLRRYMGLPEWVMKPLPMLVADRRDLFAVDVNRSVVEGRSAPDIALPACRGSAFRLAQLDEPGIAGFAGWTASPNGSPLRHVVVYSGGNASGVGFPAILPMDRPILEEASLLSDARRLFLANAPLLARVLGFHAGWIGLAQVAPGASTRLVGHTSDGLCELALR